MRGDFGRSPGVSLFDELGLDPNNFIWQDLAACKGLETNWFYDEYESDELHARNADQICYNCPVLQACALDAIEYKEEGLWGGVYWTNGRVDKARNKHKTEEEWEWLEEQIGQKIR